MFLGPGFTIDAPHGGTVIIGNGVQFRRNCRIELATPEARVTIGEGSYITYNAIIACSSTIEIGKHCGLGFCSSVYDGSHRFKDLTRPFLAQGYDLRPIRIEDHVQIHSLCTVVNSIGTRTVIGANSVVSRELPAYVLAVGAPARAVDYFGPADEPSRRSRPLRLEAVDDDVRDGELVLDLHPERALLLDAVEARGPHHPAPGALGRAARTRPPCRGRPCSATR